MHHSNKRVIRAFNRVRWFVPTFCFLMLFAFSALADGTVSLLHAFPPVGPMGVYPWSTMIRGADGNFYGTTIAGGAAYAGTIFRVTPTGILSVMYSFTNGIDGAYTRAGLVLGSDGNFYGAATYGGSDGVGTVFKMTTSSLFTPLYSFKTNGIDGQHPQSALIEGSDGSFYGTTSNGGTKNDGTIYKITPTGLLTNVHTFTGTGGDGAGPTAPLILGTDGNFYGTTAYGGTTGNGIVFRMTPQGVWTNLHSFIFGSEGARPGAALVLGNDGNFYGTTHDGGTYGYGTVFKITPDGALTPLYSFSNGSDGGYPRAPLVQGVNGNFYGTSQGSSAAFPSTDSIGTVFEITSGGVLTTLYRFTNGIDGANPSAGLVLGTNGSFFGAAETGGVIGWGSSPIRGFGRILPGAYGWGAIFTITPDGEFTPLGAFPGASEGTNPGAGLIQATNGMFYGVTERGGTNEDGTVFQMSLDGTVTPLYSFTAGNDGAVPIAALTQGSDGNLYGSTYEGGISNSGAIFKITPAGAFTVLHTFTNGIDGGHVYAAMIQGTNGNFYGTTSSGGGKNGFGTVFQLTPAGVLTTLHAFTNGIDGAGPIAGLVQGADEAFYGTAGGGTNGNGTVFKITAAGVLNTIYSFKGGVDGANPSATLISGNDGNFYGVCSGGGSTGYGTIFKITPLGVLTPVYSFTGNNDGGNPQALTLGTDGKFYGTTVYGGTNGYGSVFQITTNGVLRTLHYFDYLETSSQAYAALVQGTDGNFYIACEGAGQGYSAGTILRLTVPPVFLSMGRAGGGRTFAWNGQTGQKYQLQYNGSLSSPNWTDLGNPVTGAGPVLNATDTSPSGTQGFYRIIALP
jgi:uncharacterized repeat protein (TIGR03803 family)